MHSRAERLLDDLVVDLTDKVHALLGLSLVVRFSALGFDVLLDSIDLGLVTDQALFDISETVMDVV